MTNRIRAWSAILALGLMLAQFAAIRLSPGDTLLRIALPATIALVPVALWPHRRMLGIWVMFVGLAANLAAVLANGGLMPIERASVVAAVGAERAATFDTGAWIPGSKDVLVPDGGGVATALGDSIVVRAGEVFLVVSPGDIVIWCGLLIVAAEAAVAWERSRRRGGAGRAQALGVAELKRTQGGAATPQ